MSRTRHIVLAVAAGVACVFAGLSAAAVAFAAPTTLYVGGSGCSDAGPGTDPQQPFCTIIKAGTVVTAGQTVQVAAGTYSGPVAVTHTGSADSPIVFQSAPGGGVTIQGGQYGFSISGKSYVTVNGFAITGTVRYGIYVSTSDHITISNNVVTGAGVPAKGQIAAGIALSNTSASTVTGNTADGNSDTGIYLASGTTGTLVADNEASLNANVYQRNANGINVIGTGNSIIANTLHDNEDSGIQFYTGGNDNLATLNVSYNNGDHGIDDLNVTGGRIIGNTIFHNCTSGINVEGTSGNYVVENNVAVDNAVYPAYKGIACSRRAGNIGIWDSAPATTTVDSNLVYLSKAGTMYVFGSSYSSLSAMRAATGQEAHGIQASPGFADAANWNLQLTEGSRAIDSADSSAPGEQATDVTGASRTDDENVDNSGLGQRAYDDRGAYEFGGGGTPPPPPPPPPNNPPTARLTVTPTSGIAPLAVTADASASTDPEGQNLTYSFDFGDGTVVGPQATATAAHTYPNTGTFQVSVTVTDPGGLSSVTGATVTASPPSTSPPAYVSQIATNLSGSPHTSASVTVWRAGGVGAGHLMIATLALTGATPGTVTGTDDAHDTLTVASDITDSAGHRLVVLSGIAQQGLAPNQRITLSFPSAATYRMIADEASGVTGVDRHAESGGTSAAFSSGSTATTSSPRELVFATAGLFGGSAPSWASGWTGLTSYANGPDFVGRAYQIASSPGTFAGSGSGSGTWLASTVTFA